MPDEPEIENLLKNLERLAKSSRTEVEIKLDGVTTASARIDAVPGGGIKAVINVKDFKKALTNPALLKTALSFIAIKGKSGGAHRIEFEFESGMIKRLFGKTEDEKKK